MTKYQNLTISIFFLLLMLFEIIVFIEILKHPHMVALLLFLGCIVGFNLGAYFTKRKMEL